MQTLPSKTSLLCVQDNVACTPHVIYELNQHEASFIPTYATKAWSHPNILINKITIQSSNSYIPHIMIDKCESYEASRDIHSSSFFKQKPLHVKPRDCAKQ